MKIFRKSLNVIKKLSPNFVNAIDAHQIARYKEGIKINELANYKNLIVFWSIDGGLSPHFVSECLLAKTLQECGHSVLMIRCRKNFLRCTVMESVSLSVMRDRKTNIKRDSVCNHCQKNSYNLTQEYQLPVLELDSLVDKEQLHEIMSNLPSDSTGLVNFTYESIGFGKICAGEIIRARKRSSLAFDAEDQLAELKQYIIAALMNYLAFTKLISKTAVNHLAYFGDYAPVMPMAYIARKMGVQVTNISHASVGNVRRDKIVLMSAYSSNDYFLRLDHWELIKDYPLTEPQVRSIGNDILERFCSDAFTVFSPKKTQNAPHLFEQLNLSKTRKTIVAYTSSLDEVFATKMQYLGLNIDVFSKTHPFRDQLDWLEQLVCFIEKHPEYQLVVRIHPREAFDGYNRIDSEHLKSLYKNFLGKKYENIKFIWPNDVISSYDLAEIADLVLIAWSSVGLEVARLGVPVLAAFQYTPYPFGYFIKWEPSASQYFDAIPELLTSKAYTLASVQYAYRWFFVQRLSASLDIDDVADENFDFNSLPLFRLPKNSHLIERVLAQNQSLFEINMQNQKNNDFNIEKQALKNELKRALAFLMTGENYNAHYQMFVLHNLEMSLDFAKMKLREIDNTNVGKNAIVSILGPKIIFVDSNHSVIRYSPMAVRIVSLLCANTTESIHPAVAKAAI